MGRRLILLLVSSGTLLATSLGLAQAPASDVERALVERFGLTAGEIGQLRGGEAVMKTAPLEGPEMAAFGAVRIPDDKDRLVRWVKDIEGFRKAADLGVARKLGSPPSINDFGDLALDAGELDALRRCKPGDCALRLGDQAIARFQTEVPWDAPDAGRRANLLARQLLLKYAEAYLRGGESALGAAHDERKPRLIADDFRALIQDATNLYALAPQLAAYLAQYPSGPAIPVEEFLYWAKGGLGTEPSITLNHLVIHRDAAGGVFVANKQLYASRYVDASMLVLWLAPPPDGKGYYLLAGVRARSRLLEGFTARMLRGRIEEETRSYLKIYLDWLRKSLTPA